MQTTEDKHSALDSLGPGLLCLVLILTLTAPAAADRRYDIFELTSDDGPVNAWSINNSGQVLLGSDMVDATTGDPESSGLFVGDGADMTQAYRSNRPAPGGGMFDGVMDLYYAQSDPEDYGDGDSLSDAALSVPGHPLGDPPDRGKILVSGVNSVRVRVSYVDDAGTTTFVDDQTEVANKPTIEIAIRCVDPQGGKAVLGKVVKVQPNLGVRLVAQ